MKLILMVAAVTAVPIRAVLRIKVYNKFLCVCY